jgi:hypothetical protein
MEVIDLPEDTCIETARSTYKNGIFEITFNKKQKTKPKEEQISIELEKFDFAVLISRVVVVVTDSGLFFFFPIAPQCRGNSYFYWQKSGFQILFTSYLNCC